jgi:hypothetical protein
LTFVAIVAVGVMKGKHASKNLITSVIDRKASAQARRRPGGEPGTQATRMKL